MHKKPLLDLFLSTIRPIIYKIPYFIGKRVYIIYRFIIYIYIFTTDKIFRHPPLYRLFAIRASIVTKYRERLIQLHTFLLQREDNFRSGLKGAIRIKNHFKIIPISILFRSTFKVKNSLLALSIS